MTPRDHDDFDDIPPLVPPRDEVAFRQHGRAQPDMVNHGQYRDKVKVSTWPVRIMLGLLVLAFSGSAALAYTAYQENLQSLDQAERRISDLENRLASVGDTTEETTENILERLDFNFSEIDKLWAARNATNSEVEDLTGRVARIETTAEENSSDLGDLTQRIVQSTELVEDTRSELGSLRSELEQANERIASLDNAMRTVQSRTQELAQLSEGLGGDSASGGIDERLSRVEAAVEAIDAYRMQMNQTVRRMQDRIDAIQ